MGTIARQNQVEECVHGLRTSSSVFCRGCDSVGLSLRPLLSAGGGQKVFSNVSM